MDYRPSEDNYIDSASSYKMSFSKSYYLCLKPLTEDFIFSLIECWLFFKDFDLDLFECIEPFRKDCFPDKFEDIELLFLIDNDFDFYDYFEFKDNLFETDLFDT